MSRTAQSIRIAMLNADTSIPNEYANLGTFGDILHRVLSGAAARSHPSVRIEHAVFNVVGGEYPSTPSDFDAVIITASAASSYNSEPWIRQLEAFVLRLHREHPRIRMFGSCFGHHLICQALLGSHGARVEKHPNGWEIGISSVVFTEDFRSMFAQHRRLSPHNNNSSSSSRLPTPEPDGTDHPTRAAAAAVESPGGCVVPHSARLQFVHLDQAVLESSSLPSDWVLVGSTEHCAVQGVYQPYRVLTLQGHFEFDKFENRETMRIFGAEDSGAGAEGGGDDGEIVAELVVQFLVDAMPEADVPAATSISIGRLPTPRSSMESL